MRRIAVLSGLVLVGGLLGPSAAYAAQGDQHDNGRDRWIAVQDHITVVLPDGQTFTGNSGPMDPNQPPPVGTRLFLSEALYATDDGSTRGNGVGRTHVECTAQVIATTFMCDAALVFNGGSELLASAHLDFGSPSPQGTPFVIAVTGGTKDFFGATGEMTVTDKSTSPSESVSLYEADLVLAHK
jgi:hypothetical protein